MSILQSLESFAGQGLLEEWAQTPFIYKPNYHDSRLVAVAHHMVIAVDLEGSDRVAMVELPVWSHDDRGDLPDVVERRLYAVLGALPIRCTCTVNKLSQWAGEYDPDQRGCRDGFVYDTSVDRNQVARFVSKILVHVNEPDDMCDVSVLTPGEHETIVPAVVVSTERVVMVIAAMQGASDNAPQLIQISDTQLFEEADKVFDRVTATLARQR